MPLRRLSGLIALVALIALAGACSSDTVGPELEATYAARTVGNQQLPVTVEWGPGDITTLLADTLTFTRGGKVRRAIAVRRLGPGVPTETVFHSAGEWSYAIDGSRLVLTPFCPPNASCISSVEGRITTDRVELDFSHHLGPGSGGLTYDRLE